MSRRTRVLIIVLISVALVLAILFGLYVYFLSKMHLVY